MVEIIVEVQKSFSDFQIFREKSFKPSFTVARNSISRMQSDYSSALEILFRVTVVRNIISRT